MHLDEQLYRLPLIGWAVKRLYSYFKKNTLITDGIHIVLGLGLGLVIAGDTFFVWGVVAIAIGTLGHIYAFMKGK